MKTATPLYAAIALLALSACGDETSTSADSPATERRVEAGSERTPEKSDLAKVDPAKSKPVKSGETASVTVKAPTPMPEPEDPIISFKSEDGKLSLGRKALTMVSPVHDPDSDVWSVFVQLNKQAAEDFYTLTTETTGEALAIVVDDKTVSTPVLETAVYGGGFVFKVDDEAVASTVVAALKGEAPKPSITQVTAEDALPQDEDGDEKSVASADSDSEMN